MDCIQFGFHLVVARVGLWKGKYGEVKVFHLPPRLVVDLREYIVVALLG